MSRSIRYLLALLLTGATLSAQEAPTRLVYRAAVPSRECGSDSTSRSRLLRLPRPSSASSLPTSRREPGGRSPSGPAPAPERWTRLQDFHAEDETGREHRVTQEGARSWRVEAAGATKITLRYRERRTRIPAEQPLVPHRDLGVARRPAELALPRGGEGHFPAEVQLRSAQRLAHRHRARSRQGRSGVFTAPDYDRLIDCPTLVGNFQTWDFVVRDVPHVVAVDTGGRRLRFDPEPFVAMVRRIVSRGLRRVLGRPSLRALHLHVHAGRGRRASSTSNSTTIAPGPQAAFEEERAD